MPLPPDGLAQFSALGRQIRHRNTAADQGVLHQIFVNQDYEFARLRRNGEITRLYGSMDRPLIVDCGANLGASPVWFASRYPKAGILAVEPEADNFALLETNVAGLNVRPVHGAIAGRPGTVDVLDAGNGEWGYRTSGPGSEFGPGRKIGEVRAFALSELLALAPGATPFILKIDIEGGEGDLFDEEAEVFARFPVVVIELHDWMLPRRGTSRAFLRWQAQRDRDLVHIGENMFSMCNHLLPTVG